MTDNKGMTVGVIKVVDREMVVLMNDGYKNCKTEKKDNAEFRSSSVCHLCVDQSEEAKSKLMMNLTTADRNRFDDELKSFSGAHTSVKGLIYLCMYVRVCVIFLFILYTFFLFVLIYSMLILFLPYFN